MLKIVRLALALALTIAPGSCTRSVEISSMDFTTGKQTPLPDWECHQIFSLCRDSVTRTSFLEVTAFPKKEYPGITLPRLSGDWRCFSVLKITARIRDGRDSVPFRLSIWDGRAPAMPNNRYEKRIFMRAGWKDFAFDLSGDLETPGGRAIDKKDILQVVFFTSHQADPVVFDVASITLRERP
jgi:hypothetical protein